MRAEIRCINKSNRQSIHEAISHVGGVGWKLTLDDAIVWVERPGNSFFVQMFGREVDVIVAVGPSGRKYLRTAADTTTTNNLLSLPECV